MTIADQITSLEECIEDGREASADLRSNGCDKWADETDSLLIIAESQLAALWERWEEK